MKAEVTLSKRPRSGGESRGQIRYLDLSFDGWTPDSNGLTNGVLDNGRKPHGGYKGLMKHPMGVHSFHRGAEYQQHLQQVRQALEQEQRRSPTWALQVHSLTTHSGESPLLSGRHMAASKHEAINGRLRSERESPRDTPGSTPTPNKKAASSYYRPNRTHQYLTATELKDAADCEEVLKYGRPTRTTLLRARHRASSASSSSYEARRQKEQRMLELKKVTAFYSPEDLTAGYSDAEDQSFYSFLLGARYNRSHCLDSKSLTRHGVYMPRSNPLGCFVIGDKTQPDTAPTTAANSPRLDVGQTPRPQTQRRPTTAPSFGRKSSARAPRTPRTPRQAWGDITVSLHVTNGTRQTLTMSKDGPCRFDAKLPVVHGTSLSKLQRLKEVFQAPPAPEASEALQPPPSPISARGELSFPPAARSLDDLHHPHPVQSATDVIHKVSEENKATTQEEPEPVPEPVPEPEPEPESERLDHNQEGDNVTTEDKQEIEPKEEGEKEEEEENAETVSGGKQEEGEERDQAEAEDGLTKGENSGETDTSEGAGEVGGGDETEEVQTSAEEKNVNEDVDNASGAQDMEDATEEQDTDGGNVTTQPASSPEDNPATLTSDENENEERNGEDKVSFFVTEQADDDDKTDDVGEDVSEAVIDSLDDVPPSDKRPPDNTPQAEDDAVSTTSSKKSHSKHVSFKIPPTEDSTSVPDDDDENMDDNVEGEDDDVVVVPTKAANGAEVLDSDADDLAQGQGQDPTQEPLRVIVTHIEKNLGAPVIQEGEEVIAEDP